MEKEKHNNINENTENATLQEPELQEVEAESSESQKLIADEKDAELITKLTQQLELTQDKLLRAIAESENIRHRMNKMVEEAREYSIFSFAKDLVPVIDNLCRALLYVPENLDETSKMVIEGVKMTKNELDFVLKKHGVQAIEPKVGENFDYNNHHALSQIVTDKYEEGIIVDTMQTGYKIKDRLLRPAGVCVAKK